MRRRKSKPKPRAKAKRKRSGRAVATLELVTPNGVERVKVYSRTRAISETTGKSVKLTLPQWHVAKASKKLT